MVTILNSKKVGVFFSVDNVVRRVKRSALERYMEMTGALPAVPVLPGDQELILPVIAHIKSLCDDLRAVPIAIDMAPYIEHKQLSLGQYASVLAEFKTMLAEHGLPETKIYTCPHMPEEIIIADPENPSARRVEFKSRCECRFPGNKLIMKACAKHNIRANIDNHGNFRVWPPSVYIGSTKGDPKGAYNDEREAIIIRSSMSFIQAGAIIDGSINWQSQIDHAILKEANEIKQAAKRLGSNIGSRVDLSNAASSMLPKNF